VSGIKLDPTWVGGYAKLAANSAETLAEDVRTMAVEPLDDESFGQLGRATRATQAYGKAAQLLRGQEKVTAGYQETDETGMRAIERELQ
jgi:hypothetical protein